MQEVLDINLWYDKKLLLKKIFANKAGIKSET